MPLLAVLAACLIQQTKPPVPAPPTPGSMLLMGKNVPLQAPKQGQQTFTPDLLAWAGWGPLHVADSTVVPAYLVDGDWSGLAGLWSATQPDANAPLWRVKVLLLTETDVLATASDGMLRQSRSVLDKTQIPSILQSLVLAARTMEAQMGGKVRVAYDVQVDQELYEEDVQRSFALDAPSLEAYVTPRINAGSFEANDRIYRGPYHLCLVIHPALVGEDVTKTVACLTPTVGISVTTNADSVSRLAATIVAQNAWAADWWSDRQGGLSAAGTPTDRLLTVFGGRTPEQVTAAMNFGPVNRDSFAAFSKAPAPAPAAWDRIAPLLPSPISANAAVTLVTDPEKGPAVHVGIRSEARSGGFMIPTPKDLDGISKSANHFLVFDVKTLSNDALGVGPVVDGRPSGPGIELGERPDPGLAVDIAPDGAWHKVAIDLRQVVQPGKTTGLYIGTLPGQGQYDRTTIIDIEYTFANFNLAPSAPADASPITQRQGLALLGRLASVQAALAAPTIPANVAVISQALADHDDALRVNTLALLAKAKLPAFEEKITADIANLNPRIVQEAIAALAALDTPTARQTLEEALKSGGTHTRGLAALAVAQRKDANLAGRIGTILTLRNWHVRLMGALAESENGGQTAQNLLAGMVREDFEPDPEVRSVIVSLLDASNVEIMRQAVLFSSVNDPSDAVRAAACEKLLQCQTPELRHEGYRGVNDDSPWVRVQVLQYLAAHPTVEGLPALRQAITSPFGVVRAAALAAFAANPSAVTLDDLGPALTDTLPEVEIALIHLAIAKKLILPTDVAARLKGSSDPIVASEAAKLGS